MSLVRVAVALLLAAQLAACGSSPDAAILEPQAVTAPGAKITSLLVATNRKYNESTGQFGAGRTYETSYQAIGISIPPDHKPGEIEWPEGSQRDPAKNFVAVARDTIDENQFRTALRQRVGKSGEVLIFIHGYNTKYQEAVFRMAQIAADSGSEGANLLFSWPSVGTVAGYLRDRESANFSRDKLEEFIRLVASTPGVKKVNLLAHSMGNWLTVEMLRQAKIKGDMEFGGKLGQIILASPDIDAQVFQSQMDVIGKRNPPIVVFVSSKDRALKISSKIAGDIPRVGNVALDDPRVKAAIEKNGMVVYDLSDVESSDKLNHGTFAAAAPVIQRIGRQLNQSYAAEPGQGVGVVVLDAAGAVLGAPRSIYGAVTGR